MQEKYETFLEHSAPHDNRRIRALDAAPAPVARLRMSGLFNILLNGDPHRVAPGTSIAALALALGLDPKKIAVERNLEIVPRSTLADVLIEDGDKVEIVHFVGGG